MANILSFGKIRSNFESSGVVFPEDSLPKNIRGYFIPFDPDAYGVGVVDSKEGVYVSLFLPGALVWAKGRKHLFRRLRMAKQVYKEGGGIPSLYKGEDL